MCRALFLQRGFRLFFLSRVNFPFSDTLQKNTQQVGTVGVCVCSLRSLSLHPQTLSSQPSHAGVGVLRQTKTKPAPGYWRTPTAGKVLEKLGTSGNQ